MKQKTYQTQKPKDKSKKITFKIKVDPTKIPNKMHLDAQINNPSRVHEDKRFKKPKHKNKVFDEE
jgi:hypothetical protein